MTLKIDNEAAERFKLEAENHQREFDEHVALNLKIASILAPNVNWKNETYTTQVTTNFSPSEYFPTKDFRFDYIDDQSFRMMTQFLLNEGKISSDELRQYCLDKSNEELAKIFVERT